MDTSCAALMKLAPAVHGQGYKVALTGEGADEALAGYVWFKTQALRDKESANAIGNGTPLARPQVPARRGRRGLKDHRAALASRSAGSGRPSRTCTN